MIHHLRICELAAATLARQRAKTLVVVTVYSLLVAVVASLVLYVQALRREARLLLADAPELVVQRLTAGRHEPIPVDRAARIAAIRGVREVRPRVWGYTYDPPTGATFTLWGADSVPWSALEPVDGRGGTAAPSGADGTDGAGPGGPWQPLADGECVVGQGVADARFLWIGDRLPLRRADGELFAPRIAGIFRAESSVLTHDLVVLPTAALRRTFGLAPERAIDLAVAVHHPQEVATVARKIQELWPDVRTISRDQVLATYDAVFDWRGGVWVALLLAVAAAFTILVWDRATGLSSEELHTLGLLKAVGWSPRDVLELCLWQGVIVSALSVATGLLLAQAHLLWLDGALFTRLLRGWSVLFPELEIHPGADALALLICLPLTVLPYVVANLLPSWRAAITDPDTILRS